MGNGWIVRDLDHFCEVLRMDYEELEELGNLFADEGQHGFRNVVEAVLIQRLHFEVLDHLDQVFVLLLLGHIRRIGHV